MRGDVEHALLTTALHPSPFTTSQTDTTAPKYRFPAVYFRTSQCTRLNSPAGTFLVVMAMETTVAKSVPLGIHFSKANVGGCFGFCKQQPIPRERSHVTQAQKQLTQSSCSQSNCPATLHQTLKRLQNSYLTWINPSIRYSFYSPMEQKPPCSRNDRCNKIITGIPSTELSVPQEGRVAIMLRHCTNPLPQPAGLCYRANKYILNKLNAFFSSIS